MHTHFIRTHPFVLKRWVYFVCVTNLVVGLSRTIFTVLVLNAGTIVVLAIGSTRSAAEASLFYSFPVEFLIPLSLTALVKSYQQEATQRDIFITSLKLRERRTRAEMSRDRVFRLLEKAPLPRPIIASLRRGIVPKRDEIGTFLFADIVGFTAFSSRVSAKMLVKILNSLFIACDTMAEQMGVTKIKTLGDCYVAATGILGGLGDDISAGGGDEDDGHAAKMCRFALRLHGVIEDLNEEHGLVPKLRWRIGVHSGSCIGGVIGSKKCVVALPLLYLCSSSKDLHYCFSHTTQHNAHTTHTHLLPHFSIRFIYDLWGSAVTTANLMEEHGKPGRVRFFFLLFSCAA